MRIMASILVLFFLGSSMIPCCDNIELFGEVHAHAMGDQDHDDAKEEDAHGDHCTPFCSCDCCGVQLVPPIALSVNFYTQPTLLPHISGTNLIAPSVGAIWHPPKVEVYII